MPLYHFELVGPDSTYSLEGAFLRDEVHATSIARGIADELNPKLTAQDYEIVIKNEHGDEICRVPIDRAR
jgi:hypothetical protein